MKTDARRAKPVSDATQRLLDEMRQDAAPSEDKLERARAAVARLRDRTVEAGELSQRLAEVNQDITHIREKTIVDLFDEVGIDALGIPAFGNLPAYEVEIGEWVRATIPKKHEAVAFAHLQKTGHADLIKTTFTVSFGLGDSKKTAAFEKLLAKNRVQYERKQGVPWNTLTAWYKAERAKKPLPARAKEILGVTEGRIANLINSKEKK